jgi:aryl-alcohol dehydrogenase-like predicted oxidoreductase
MCREEGLATLCYNPLAGGLLTGKHRDLAAPDAQSRFGSGKAAGMYKERYWHEREFNAVSRIAALAKQAGIPPARLAVAWVLAQPGVTCAIIGASRTEQLPELLAADGTTLEAPVLAQLDEITREFRTGDAQR